MPPPRHVEPQRPARMPGPPAACTSTPPDSVNNMDPNNDKKTTSKATMTAMLKQLRDESRKEVTVTAGLVWGAVAMAFSAGTIYGGLVAHMASLVESTVVGGAIALIAAAYFVHQHRAKKNPTKPRANDAAVSPVIAVILMVAITVVLAAVVYVWVSGFGNAAGTGPAGSLSLASADTIDASAHPGDYVKAYTVTSASPGLRYSQLSLRVNGTAYAFDVDACDPDAAAVWTACAGTTQRAASDVLMAGDTLRLRADDSPAGTQLQVVDANANSVIATMTIG